ncbi:hypothetical protein KY348_06940 [Candidatus Woesearchaeota archaeon]|nr:hypothetical protein [Candidatus Woesearchaeota archaeon]
MKKSFNKIMTSMVMLIFLFGTIALVSGSEITGKVIEISPTSVAEYPAGTAAGKTSSEGVVTTTGKPMPATCVDKCGDGICPEGVCLGTGCPCPETAESCPGDCAKGISECDTTCKQKGYSFGRCRLGPAGSDDTAGWCLANEVDIGTDGCAQISTITGEISYISHCCCMEKPACAKEGEKVNKNPGMGPTDGQCCEGLTEIMVSRSYSVCVNCGDGVCKSPENAKNCPQDCAETKCSDSDGGKDQYVAGRTCVGSECKADSCITLCADPGGCRAQLIEYYCDGNNIESQMFECPNGCSSSACIKEPVTDSCDTTCQRKGYASGECRIGPVYMDTADSVDSATKPEYVGFCYDREVDIGVDGCPHVAVGPLPPGTNITIPHRIQSYHCCCGPEEPEPVCTPVCKAMGSRSEGWYDSCTGELIKYDNCACVAVCKGGVGGGYGTVRHEGYYSSCTGELILRTDCSVKEPIKVEIKKKEVTIEQKPVEGVVLISSEDVAVTKEKLMVAEGSLGISTETGVATVAYLPEEVKQTAMTKGGMKKVTNIELVEESGSAVYRVNGKVKGTILWIIPVTKDGTVKVDAETNEIIE